MGKKWRNRGERRAVSPNSGARKILENMQKTIDSVEAEKQGQKMEEP